MNVLFLDESGTHNLAAYEPSYPLFVLGGVITDQEYADGTLTSLVRQFKLDLFGREEIILHTADITRNRGGFKQMKDPVFRRRFYDELNALMRTLHYTVVACVIKKDQYLARYGVQALDPYMLSLHILVERFCYEIGDRAAGGVILAEKREIGLDQELDLAWKNLTIRGTEWVKPKDVRKRITGLTSHSKSDNIAGLQLADLVVTPIGRFIQGKTINEDFRIVEEKLRRHEKTGEYWGTGLVVLPKLHE